MHRVRKGRELTERLWEFKACEGEHANQVLKVATPSCWEGYPGYAGYRGKGIYTTTFEAEGNIRLECKGVCHTATVYLDGKKIAEHYNAYTSFATIVKDLPKGEHILEILADNSFSEKSALHIPNDYMSYGGIGRPVVLETIEDVYIKNILVTPCKTENGWNAQVQVCLVNVSDEKHVIDLDTILSGKGLKKEKWSKQGIVVEPKEELVISESMACKDVVEWCPEEPELYYITSNLYEQGVAIDDYIDRFGFRQIAIEGKKILLNNKALRIKGVCRHEDHPQFTCALPYAAMAADLQIIKDMGCNSVRTSHYPNDEVFLDLCDEEGILVWEENHARGLSLEDMQNPNFEPQAENVIREMIPLHYNHPSIYIWGILNECASDSEYGKDCYAKQFALIKELDPSRPRSFASFKFKTDICFGLPEVVSYNIYPLWYHDTPVDAYLDDLYQWVQKETEGAGKPFLITEVGAGAIYGYHDAYNSKWTEEYQAEALEKQLQAILGYDDCSGVYIWQFCDVKVSKEWFDKRPRTMNNKGIVDEYRRKKQSYEVVKNLFHSYGNYF